MVAGADCDCAGTSTDACTGSGSTPAIVALDFWFSVGTGEGVVTDIGAA